MTEIRMLQIDFFLISKKTSAIVKPKCFCKTKALIHTTITKRWPMRDTGDIVWAHC